MAPRVACVPRTKRTVERIKKRNRGGCGKAKKEKENQPTEKRVRIPADPHYKKKKALITAI